MSELRLELRSRAGFDLQDECEIDELAMTFVRAIRGRYGDSVDPWHVLVALPFAAARVISAAPSRHRGELLEYWADMCAKVPSNLDDEPTQQPASEASAMLPEPNSEMSISLTTEDETRRLIAQALARPRKSES